MASNFLRRPQVRLVLVLALTGALASCNDSGSGGKITRHDDPNPDAYTYLTGDSEPLYPFQWALDYNGSWFNGRAPAFHGGYDLKVAEAHRQGFKGQGIRVLVLDSGVDLRTPDLQPNADPSLSWNFVHRNADPYPTELDDHEGVPHGTAVAGIIAAAQNGQGVMGIAPRVRLGGANILESSFSPLVQAQAYGGATWSRHADVFNASYGSGERVEPYDDLSNYNTQDLSTPIIRGLKALRQGKGAIFIKAAGNSYAYNHRATIVCDHPRSSYACVNPANDRETLEPNIINVAALNTMGQAASYSSAGPVIWVSGLAGEFGAFGTYGENPDSKGGGTTPLDGPTLFTTDMSGCANGYSYRRAETPFLRGESQRHGVADNPNCDYGYMNGTSAASPSIAGVAAAILGANPDLSWRDVRDILRLSARPVDEDYPERRPIVETGTTVRYGALMDLTTNALVDTLGSRADIADGSTQIPLDLGWQTNAAGRDYSNRYGFGLPDMTVGVALAQAFARDPALGRTTDVHIPGFTPVAYWHKNQPDAVPLDKLRPVVPQELVDGFPYQKVSLAGALTVAPGSGSVDSFQVRLSGDNVCLGALGMAVKSPNGTMSILKLPNDHFNGGIRDDLGNLEPVDEFEYYGLGSYAFYDETAAGDWELYVLASNPDTAGVRDTFIDCPSSDGGQPNDFAFLIEARAITQ